MRVCLLIAAALVLGIPGTASAYLDPGSGSLLLQLLLGGFAGLAVAARLLWRRLARALGRPGPDGRRAD